MKSMKKCVFELLSPNSIFFNPTSEVANSGVNCWIFFLCTGLHSPWNDPMQHPILIIIRTNQWATRITLNSNYNIKSFKANLKEKYTRKKLFLFIRNDVTHNNLHCMTLGQDLQHKFLHHKQDQYPDRCSHMFLGQWQGWWPPEVHLVYEEVLRSWSSPNHCFCTLYRLEVWPNNDKKIEFYLFHFKYKYKFYYTYNTQPLFSMCFYLPPFLQFLLVWQVAQTRWIPMVQLTW